jgi:hypothetical protein
MPETEAPVKTPTKAPERTPEEYPKREEHYRPERLCPDQRRDGGSRTI